MGKQKNYPKWRLLLVISCLIMFMAVPVLADNTVISDARDAVVQIRYVYRDDNNNETPIQYGSGFLIGPDYVLTNYHVVHMNDKTRKDASEALGVDFVNNLGQLEKKGNIQLQVVVYGDMYRTASIVQDSAGMDLAALKLNEGISDRKYLSLGEPVGEGDTIWALGFPAIATLKDFISYTSNDVTMTDGKITQKTTMEGINYLQNSAKISDGSSGGPLLNNDGNVVGVTTSEKGGYYYAVDISEVKQLLSVANIEYIEAGGTSGDSGDSGDDGDSEAEMPTVAPAETLGELPLETQGQAETAAHNSEVDKSTLESAIAAAEAIEAGQYSDDSYEALQTAISDARMVLDNGNASSVDVDAATTNLSEKTKALQTKASFPIIPVAVGAAIVVIILIIVIVVVVSGGKKKKPVAAPVRQPQPQPQPMPQNQMQGGYQQDAGGTTVLSQGSDTMGTTVLGGGQAGTATLLRLKNRENIPINRSQFVIGSNRAKVNYCVADNTSVSRCHAMILRKNGEYYIVDQNSTNFTFVNGRQIAPQQEVRLQDGDKIRMSDEEFVFNGR